MTEPDSHMSTASLTPLQRLEWLEQTLDLLRDTEALAADRERRRLAAARWWADTGSDGHG